MKDTESIRKELHARLDPIIEDFARELARHLDDDAIFKTTAEYAKHRKVSVKTVRKWIEGGLPGVNRRMKPLRIKVAEADGWSEEDASDATRRSAEMDAHGAKR